jgi:hypothetical protein
MFITMRDEINKQLGKKLNDDHKHTYTHVKDPQSEAELIHMIEQMLNEEKNKIATEAQILKEQTMKRRKLELQEKSKIGDLDNMGETLKQHSMTSKAARDSIVNKPNQSLYDSQNNKNYQAFKNTNQNEQWQRSRYPIDKSEYDKVLREKEENDLREDNKTYEEPMNFENSIENNEFRRFLQTYKGREKQKEKASNKNPWVKHEYNHPGTFVRIIII